VLFRFEPLIHYAQLWIKPPLRQGAVRCQKLPETRLFNSFFIVQFSLLFPSGLKARLSAADSLRLSDTGFLILCVIFQIVFS
jgi:hypothetical protein